MTDRAQNDGDSRVGPMDYHMPHIRQRFLVMPAVRSKLQALFRSSVFVRLSETQAAPKNYAW